MKILAQGINGISNFLHPDYVSAAPSPSFKLNLFDDVFTAGDLAFIYSMIVLAVGVLLVFYILYHNKHPKIKK
ncbi:MAG: hypothetical protein ACFFDH_06620 [Promethearchaeota archaeon]